MTCAERLKQAGYDLELITDFAQVQSRVAELHSQGQLRAVISAGGDGHIARLSELLASHCPFHRYPVRDRESAAKYLDWQADPELLAQRIQNGCTVT